MEPDRYTDHQKLFITGITCLVLAITFFFFSFYILPFLIWRLNYQVPGFVIMLQTYFQDSGYSLTGANIMVWLIFFIPSIITGIIAYYISNNIENQIYKVETSESEIEEEEEKETAPQVSAEIKESAGLAFKIIFLIVILVLFILLLQLVLTS